MFTSQFKTRNDNVNGKWKAALLLLLVRIRLKQSYIYAFFLLYKLLHIGHKNFLLALLLQTPHKPVTKMLILLTCFVTNLLLKHLMISFEDCYCIQTYVCLKLYNVIPTQTVPSINKRNSILFSFKQVGFVKEAVFSDPEAVTFDVFDAVVVNMGVWFK